jgi:hypothetical protein
MPAATLQAFLDHLRKLTDPNRSRKLSDADLLERFRRNREEAAFTLFLQRHGPMVYGTAIRPSSGRWAVFPPPFPVKSNPTFCRRWIIEGKSGTNP